MGKASENMNTTPTFEPLKILIVEDDLDLVETYTDLLESEGHQVHAITNSTQALDYLLIARNRPDLVILDMHLPGGSGFLVLGLVRKLPRLAQTQVIVASGFPEMAQRAVDNWGASVFLQKPIQLDALRTTIQRFKPTHIL